MFKNFSLKDGELTITGTVDLDADEDALAPLTIALTDDIIQSVTVAEGATFNAEGNTVDGPVTCNGTITGGTFTGKITSTGKLAGGDFSGADISGFKGTITGGTFAGYTISVIDSKLTLTITGENGAAVTGTIRDAGTYTVKVALDCDNYALAAGGDSFTITVRPLDLSGEDVVLRVEGPLTVGYTGASVYPQIEGNMLEVELNGKYCGALPVDCFTIEAAEGKNDVNAGDAYLTIVGRGNASGEAELAYTIIAKDIADAGVTVEPIGELVYTGSALEPSVTVKDGEKALVKGTDYAVTYANNTNAGTATVTITGKGNYTGETEVTFEIVRKDIAEDEGFTIDPIPDQVYTGGEIEPEIVVKDGETVLVEGEDYEVSYGENTDAGTVTVTITGTGKLRRRDGSDL